MRKPRTTPLALTVSLLLAACSGGDGEAPPEERTTTAGAAEQTEQADPPQVEDAQPKEDAVQPPPKADAKPRALAVGDPAPAFELKDDKGNTHELSDYAGKIVVLEWFNPDCPYMPEQYLGGGLKGISGRWVQEGVVWFHVSSAGPGQEGHGVKTNTLFREKWNQSGTFLFDESGEVGRAYGAIRTPEFFVLDKEQRVAFHGPIDNCPKPDPNGLHNEHNLLPGHTEYHNYVEEALTALKAGEPVAIPHQRPWGCRIRYAPKND